MANVGGAANTITGTIQEHEHDEHYFATFNMDLTS